VSGERNPPPPPTPTRKKLKGNLPRKKVVFLVIQKKKRGASLGARRTSRGGKGGGLFVKKKGFWTKCGVGLKKLISQTENVQGLGWGNLPVAPNRTNFVDFNVSALKGG